MNNKSRPRRDRSVKVTHGALVHTGTILVRGLSMYKPGLNVGGQATLFALCRGHVAFSRKKIPSGSVRTFVSVIPKIKKSA